LIINFVDDRYFDWLMKDRDIDKSGLITILHPWESGIDLSPAYDPALGVPNGTI
jgi:alpha,alpha-trehalase